MLDLAAGRGRNALFLAHRGCRVRAIDRSSEALLGLAQAAEREALDVVTEARDVEADPTLPREAFAAVVVCRFLHRPLFPALRAALAPGGLLIYETFTVEHAPFGKPTHPDHLLTPNELLHRFIDWRVLRYFEGVVDGRAALASIAARKPGPRSSAAS